MEPSSKNSASPEDGQPSGRCPFTSRAVIAETPQPEQVPHPMRVSLPGIAAAFFGSAGQVADEEMKSALEGAIVKGIPSIRWNLDFARQLLKFPTDPRAAFSWANETYGDAAQLLSPNGQLFHIHSDAAVIKEVLKLSDAGKRDKFDKSGFLSDGVGWAIGRDNVLVSSNDTWKSRHKVMAPQFGRTNFESPHMVRLMQSVIDQTMGELEDNIKQAGADGVEIDLQDEMSIVALRVALSGIFGLEDISREELAPVRDAFRKVFSAFPYEAVTPFDIPYDLVGTVVPQIDDISKSKEFLVEYVDSLIERILANPSPRPNPISALLKAHDSATGSGVPHEVIRSEVLTMLFAGHETTGNIFGWTFGALSERPDLQTEILRDAFDTDFRAASGLSELQEEMPFVKQTVMESLRFFPPVYVLLRRATEDVQISTEEGQVVIPNGTEVLLNIFDSQRNEEQWGEEKTGFRADFYEPRRWAEDNIQARGLRKDDLRLFSFGSGARVCVGTHLFMTEAMLVLANYTQKFQFEPLFNGIENGMTSDFTLQREGGFPAKATLRKLC